MPDRKPRCRGVDGDGVATGWARCRGIEGEGQRREKIFVLRFVGGKGLWFLRKSWQEADLGPGFGFGQAVRLLEMGPVK